MKKIKLISVLLAASCLLLAAVVLSVFRYAKSAEAELPPPAGVTASAAAGQNTVSWEKTPYATSYRVFRRGVGGVWEQIGAVSASGTEYTDPASPADVCQYAVRAFHHSFFTVDVLSELSEGASAVPAGFELVLAAPEVGAERTEKGITVTWTKVDYATSYRLYHRTSGGDWSLVKAFGASQLSYTGEFEGKSIEYAVRSCSALTGETVLSGYSAAVRPEQGTGQSQTE